jgi:hypothetical protein
MCYKNWVFLTFSKTMIKGSIGFAHLIDNMPEYIFRSAINEN